MMKVVSYGEKVNSMKSHQSVGISLIGQAHIGLIIFMCALILSLMVSINISALIYGGIFGVITGALLLGYWLGKGGRFFLLAILSPLILIVVSPLASFADIANVLGAFFVGLCGLLCIYRLKKGS